MPTNTNYALKAKLLPGRPYRPFSRRKVKAPNRPTRQAIKAYRARLGRFR